MATSSPTVDRPSDPIDALVPPLRPWWLRLTIAVATIAAVGLIGWCWRFGVLRPAPDCCGSGSSTPQIGLSDQAGAVTITTYFFNSSSRAVAIDGVDADLPGARVVGIAPYRNAYGWEMPPRDLGTFPTIVEGGASVWLAVSFEPDACDAGALGVGAGLGEDWGTVTLDLSRPGDHWYPTVGRRFPIPNAVVEAGPNSLGVLPPASLDGAFAGNEHPLGVACRLLGR